MRDPNPRLVAAWAHRRWWRARRALGLVPNDNTAYNRSLWDAYSRSWTDPDFRRAQMDGLRDGTDPGHFEVLGEEWASSADLELVIDQFITPNVDSQSRVAEIGVGGGRLAVRVAPQVGELICFDISTEMLRRAAVVLSEHSNVTLARLDDARLPAQLSGTLDFIYCFDVFLHLDLHTMWRYVQEMARALRPGGRALIHALDLTAPEGWEEFSKQKSHSVEYGWFVSPDIVRTLVTQAGLTLAKESERDPTNVYLNRDYLVIAEKR